MGGGGVGRGGRRSVCLCVSESAPTRRGAGSSPNSAPFQPGRNCCHFLGNPTFTAGGARDGAVRFTPLTRAAEALADLGTPPPRHFPPFLSLLYDFFMWLSELIPDVTVDLSLASGSWGSCALLCPPARTARWVHGLWRGLCSPVAAAEFWVPRPPPSPSV